MKPLHARSITLRSLVLGAGAFALASCAKAPRIEKEVAISAPEPEVATPAPKEGSASQAPSVETKTETPTSVSVTAPKPLDKAPSATAKAWDDAETVAVHEKGCDVRRIDSFVRVKCAGGNRIEQLVGDTRGVSFGCYDSGDAKCAVFRLAPGDRRVVQFSDAAFVSSGGWGGSTMTLDKVAVVSAWWPKGATSPKITVD